MAINTVVLVPVVILVAFISGVMSDESYYWPAPAPAPKHHVPPPPPKSFGKTLINETFFIHETLFVPNSTDLVVAGPGGDLSSLQRGSIIVVDDVITKTKDPESKVIGTFRGQYIQTGTKALRVEATVTLFGKHYNTTYEIIGLRSSILSKDDIPLAVVSGIKYSLSKQEYIYGLTGVAFIDTLKYRGSQHAPKNGADDTATYQGNVLIHCRNNICH